MKLPPEEFRRLMEEEKERRKKQIEEERERKKLEKEREKAENKAKREEERAVKKIERDRVCYGSVLSECATILGNNIVETPFSVLLPNVDSNDLKF